MGKLYFIDIHFQEPTKIYEMVPKEVASFDNATLDVVTRYLVEHGLTNVLVDGDMGIVSSLKDASIPQVNSIRYTPEKDLDDPTT